MTQWLSAVEAVAAAAAATTYDRQHVSHHRRRYCLAARRAGEFLSAGVAGCETSSVFMSTAHCLLWVGRRRYKTAWKGPSGGGGRRATADDRSVGNHASLRECRYVLSVPVACICIALLYRRSLGFTPIVLVKVACSILGRH